MNNTTTHIHVNNAGMTSYAYDPTRTTTLRNAFARDMRVRFVELMKVVKVGIVDNDCFGLISPMTQQMIPPQQGQFIFPMDADKLQEFLVWFEAQVEAGILKVGVIPHLGIVSEDSWMNLYLLDSYKRGILRARAELRKAGYNVPPIDPISGINAVLSVPVHVNTLRLIYARAFQELKGVTTTMGTQISRVLAQGLADGDHPRFLARKIVSTIGGKANAKLGITDTLGRFIPAKRRAEMIARTETIRAHHLATIQEYENWGAAGAYVHSEWMTAGDNRVCPDCEGLEGELFTLDAIRNMIPLHPQCRCIALPYIVKGNPTNIIV